MAKRRPVVQEAPQVATLEITVGRVKKDLVWMLLSVVVAVGLGLLAGQFIKI